ncbi:MAG: lysostaphin resistance A-like protein [Candidatus Promineifilaceae bacterium]
MIQIRRDTTPPNLTTATLALLALTTMAELALIYANAAWCLVLHLVVTVAVVFLAAGYEEDSAEYRYYLALLLVPLTRIMSLALPLAAWSQVTWYAAVSIPLFVTMGVLMRRFSFSLKEMIWGDFRLMEQTIIALIGIPLGVAEYLILRPVPIVPALTWEQVWLPALILLISTGLLEELLFRGILQQTGLAVLRPWAAQIFVSLLFAVLHIGYASFIDVVFVFSVGLLFGVIAYHTRSLVGITIAHGFTNIGLFIVWPFFL